MENNSDYVRCYFVYWLCITLLCFLHHWSNFYSPSFSSITFEIFVRYFWFIFPIIDSQLRFATKQMGKKVHSICLVQYNTIQYSTIQYSNVLLSVSQKIFGGYVLLKVMLSLCVLWRRMEMGRHSLNHVNLGTLWRWVISFMLRLLDGPPWGKDRLSRKVKYIANSEKNPIISCSPPAKLSPPSKQRMCITCHGCAKSM